MRVQVADMSYKKEKTVTSGAPVKKAQRTKADIERYKEIAAKQKAWVISLAATLYGTDTV